MITVITNKQEIKSLHKLFHRGLDKFMTEYINCLVGHPGENFEDTVRYSTELGIWISMIEHSNKFWNGFGVGRPIEGKNNSLNGEINFPYEGINRRIAGAFAKEDDGNILVLHRGKIGGGKPGIGKHYFKENYRGDFVSAIDGDRETEFCLVGELNSVNFPNQVSIFINEIYRVKSLEKADAASSFPELSNFKYTEEHSGRTVTERNDPIVRERTHGIVVNALAEQLEGIGLKVGNDRNRDLFIHNGKKIKVLFEVKTSSSTQCLYSAIGQLLLYSVPINNPVKLVAVLPEKLSKPVVRRFAELGIELLYYTWKDKNPNFEDIDQIF